MRVLHKMFHGLGDVAMFTSILRHLEKQKPDWENFVLTHPGKHTCHKNGLLALPPEPFDTTFDHHWRESKGSYSNAPGTKAVRCLREVFGITPEWELLKYRIEVGEAARQTADSAVRLLPARPFVLIHYLGESNQGGKNLTHGEVQAVCDWLKAQGLTPVIVDWERRSPLPDDSTIFRAAIPQDAETLAALVSRAALFVGIDSGPCKVAYSTSTPVLAVWTGMHPYHYCDNAPNAFHLVPAGHEGMLKGNREQALRFFQDHYRFEEYDRALLPQYAIIRIASMLNIRIEHMSNLLKSTVFDARYYLEHKIAGLDYLDFGEWQRRYGRWFVEALDLKGKTVLDVGCACGSIAAGFAIAGTLVSGIDPNEHMIRLGREKWLATTLKIGDAVNLHYWGDETFDFIHSAQVFEHFKPELVPFILDELWRVLKDGGRMYFCLDTEELYQRQNRKIENEDATHTCVKPLDWWLELLINRSAWGIDYDAMEKLHDHPDNYLKDYDWDFLCVRKV